MAIGQFWARPNLGAQRKTKPRIQSTRFGDGYELRIKDGINVSPVIWANLVFTAHYAEHKAQLDFIEAQAGATAFEWTDPRGDTRKFVCREWASEQVGLGVYELTCDFEEVFDL